MPKRIQRSRAAGWRMPENTVYVGRPSRWGNPYHLTMAETVDGIVFEDDFPCGIGIIAHIDECMDLFRAYAVGRFLAEPKWIEPLIGKDLACWCPLNKPCHSEILLEIAALEWERKLAAAKEVANG